MLNVLEQIWTDLEEKITVGRQNMQVDCPAVDS